MSTTDLLRDTYVAALQHGHVDLTADPTLVGVVRRPTGWVSSAVDENYRVLGPPPDLLHEFKERHEAFKMQGICDEGAHNAAWDAVEFAERYHAYLDETPDAQDALSELVDRLRAREALVLVCYENTAQKRCHRTLLRERLTTELAGSE